MKKVKVDDVWPRYVIATQAGVGRVLQVKTLHGNKNVAEILFSWHQDGLGSITMDWNDAVSVLDDEEITDLVG